jgi:hypothetical protein
MLRMPLVRVCVPTVRSTCTWCVGDDLQQLCLQVGTAAGHVAVALRLHDHTQVLAHIIQAHALEVLQRNNTSSVGGATASTCLR